VPLRTLKARCRQRSNNDQSSNGKQGTELADLIVHKVTEAVNAISFK